MIVTKQALTIKTLRKITNNSETLGKNHHKYI